MCCVKISPKKTTINIGEINIDVDVELAYNSFNPNELVEHIYEFIKVNNEGTWSINNTKTNRMDIMFTNTLGKLDYINDVITIYNNKLKSNVTNYDLVPRSIIFEYISIVDDIGKDLLTNMIGGAIPVYISIIDNNCQYDEESLKSVLDMLSGVSKNKIDFTLIIDNNVDVLTFEKYRLELDIIINKIHRKSIVINSIIDDINIISFAYDYGFRCYNPFTLDYSNFDSKFKNINESLLAIALQLNEIKDKLNEGG